MFNKKKLPIGIDKFDKLIESGFYYVDKTMLIKDLLSNWGETNLFTRPRRFGKSLNMSMLKNFFEIGCNKNLFQSLNISQEKQLCEMYMGQFPVISITLKGVDGLTFASAFTALRNIIGKEALRFEFLLESCNLSMREKEIYAQLIKIGDGQDAIFAMSDSMVLESLHLLSMLLSKHYGRNVIILIDEYDVPLDKAFQSGYYNEMVSVIRNLLGNALKSNEYLQFAVLTGCLRISKEIIFTGLNNIKIHTIADNRYNEYFGFTDNEVKSLLNYYNISDRAGIIKEWYNGYQFGSTSVYCPWDVLNYCDAVLADSNVLPENYWANTSGNTLVRRFIDKANQQTKKEIEQLIAGSTITKPLNMELTYNELDSTIENIWSVLFTTGYLTQRGRDDNNDYKLAIPNREIHDLFISQISQWFKDTTRADGPRIERFCLAFPNADVNSIEEMLNDYLWNTISIRDTSVRSKMKENFYHGMLLGLLQYKDLWFIKSNAESGEGYSDILIETPQRIGIVIEVKYAEDDNLDKWCNKALEQIETNNYAARLIEDGMKAIVKYGIAFYKKHCKVVLG